MATRRKQDDRNLEVLRELIAAGENRYCFDCGTRGPTYVNTTIGSFVCSKCSGMLRGLTPPHRVKSISMAIFTNEEMDLIRARGNEYCRQIWLSLYEGDNTHPKDEQSIRDFMLDKYEKKRYYLNPESVATLRSLQDTQVKPAQTTPLVSIAPQVSKPTMQVSRPSVNNLLPPVSSGNVLPRPTNNHVPLSLNANLPAKQQVPEWFTADFSTANIYNSSEHNNNNKNVVVNATPHINNNIAFNSPAPPSNDRYAALADLDIELRQQKCLNTIPQENGTVNKNPFQSTSSDLFANKNPFSNGLAWNNEPATLTFNPFAPCTNMNGFSNSKNPFL